MNTFVSKHEIAPMLGLKNPDSVKHCHKKWINGIHYYSRGSRRAGYRYNLELIQHWQNCHEDVSHPSHIQMMKAYQKSFQINTRKSR